MSFHVVEYMKTLTIPQHSLRPSLSVFSSLPQSFFRINLQNQTFKSIRMGRVHNGRHAEEQIMKAIIILTLSIFNFSALAISENYSLRDCQAIASENLNFCETADCKAILSGDFFRCSSDDCRAIVDQNPAFCRSLDCRAIVFKNPSVCSGHNCRAIIQRSPEGCR